MKEYLYALATDQRNDWLAQCVKGVMWVLSLMYGAITWSRNALYDVGVLKAYSAGIPVISVGNMTMGGAGKSPLVECIVRHIIKQGRKPVILMRGYMQRSDAVISDEREVFDEKFPQVEVLVGADRRSNIQKFLAANTCDVFVMDDGYQHRQVQRDLNIAVVDATCPFGNRSLIPRGILREGLGALKRADVIVLSRADLAGAQAAAVRAEVQSRSKDVKILEASHRPCHFVNVVSGETYPLNHLQGARAIAFCGIGNPSAFFKTLDQLKIQIARADTYIDHYEYRREDIDQLSGLATEHQVGWVITTQKDAVKLKQIAEEIPDGIHLVYLEINLEIINGQEEFIARIDHLLRR